MSNLCPLIFETESIVITYKSESKKSLTFITVIMQIRTFSLNLGTSIRILKQLNIP